MNWKRVQHEKSLQKLREDDPTMMRQPDPGALPLDPKKEHERSRHPSSDRIAQRLPRKPSGPGPRKEGLGRGRRRGDQAANAWAPKSASQPRSTRVVEKKPKVPNLGDTMKCTLLDRASPEHWQVQLSKGRKGLLEHRTEYCKGQVTHAIVIGLQPGILLRRSIEGASENAGHPSLANNEDSAPLSKREQDLQIIVESQQKAIGRHESAAETVIWDWLVQTATTRRNNRSQTGEIAGSLDVLADLFRRAAFTEAGHRFAGLAARLRRETSLENRDQD